jgi:hypothetical protein
MTWTMTSLLPLLLACVPVFRYPGPTRDLGRVEDEGPWERVEDERVVVAEASPDVPEEKPARRTWRAPRGLDGDDVAKAAGYYVGKRVLTCAGEQYRYDCSGLVNVIYRRAGLDIGKYNAAMMWQLAKEHDVLRTRGEPLPGDVVFFDNTYDRNKDGRLNDELTHVAVVESMADDGTATMVHKGSKGVVRITMNLRNPGERRGPEGEDWNAWLRVRKSGDSKDTPYLSGELYVGHASFWAVEDFYIDGQVDQGIP